MPYNNNGGNSRKPRGKIRVSPGGHNRPYRENDRREKPRDGQNRDNTREGNAQGGYQQRREQFDKPRDNQRRGQYVKPRDTFERKPFERKPERVTEAAPKVEPIQQIQQQEQTLPYFLMGRNAVREAVKNSRSIDRILVIPEQDGSLREIVNLARDRGVVIRITERKKLDELCMPFGHNGRTGNHQGIVAMVPDVEYATLDDILEHAKSLDEPPFVLLLDGINDPHNLGSMLRSAACAGVHGVVITKRRCATVTAAVSKISAGAVEHVKIARVTNLSSAIDQLKSTGMWIAGAMQEGDAMQGVDLRGPLGLVIGNEGDGLSRLIREKCDYHVAIPMKGKMESLNASVAAAILLFEKNRQDAQGK